jgi:integrase
LESVYTARYPGFESLSLRHRPIPRHPIKSNVKLKRPRFSRQAKTPSHNTILKGLERMGYKGRMTGHGFRGIASTILHEQGYAHEHIELQLAHAPRNAVSAAYNHALHLKARAKMMQDWADFLERAQRGPKVLPFPEVVA